MAFWGIRGEERINFVLVFELEVQIYGITDKTKGLEIVVGAESGSGNSTPRKFPSGKLTSVVLGVNYRSVYGYDEADLNILCLNPQNKLGENAY